MPFTFHKSVYERGYVCMSLLPYRRGRRSGGQYAFPAVNKKVLLINTAVSSWRGEKWFFSVISLSLYVTIHNKSK